MPDAKTTYSRLRSLSPSPLQREYVLWTAFDAAETMHAVGIAEDAVLRRIKVAGKAKVGHAPGIRTDKAVPPSDRRSRESNAVSYCFRTNFMVCTLFPVRALPEGEL